MNTKSFGSAAILAIVAGSALAAGDLQWRNADGVATFEQAHPRLAPAEMLNQLSGQAQHVIVRLADVPSAQQKAALADAGVRLLSPLGGSAYFASIAADMQPSRVIRAANFDSIDYISPAHRLDPRLADETAPAWALAGPKETAGSNPIIGVYVQFQQDVPLASAAAREVITENAGVIRDKVEAVNMFVVEMPFGNIAGLAEDDRVQWIEAPLPRFEGYNAENRARVQANEAQAAPYNLDGAGVTAYIYDAGSVLASHLDYSGRATVFDGSGVHYHSTHVGGTVGGDGSAIFNNRGMAPGVTILSSSFEYDGSGTFLYTNPGDLLADYTTAVGMGADVSNNSIGSNVAPNGFPCSYEGDYGLCAATIDAVVRGAAGGDIVIFWAAGNERGYGCGNTYNTSPPPGNNKNAITVGALNSNDDSMTSFSSWGPADDGRMRPVIAAPGCQVGGDGGVTSLNSTSNSSYTTLCGTSMASPTACGVGALVMQDFRANYPGRPDPSNQLMKAFFCHNSVDLGNTGPDNTYGYGSIRAVNIIDFERTGNFDEGSVDNGGIGTFTVDVNAGDPELKITLVWDDVPGTPNTIPSLVNDLDLVVVDPSGGRHYPWTVNPSSPGTPAVQTQEDHLNNIEQVQVANPQAGRWMVQVVGTTVPDGPQGFAITATPALGPGLLAVSLLSDVPDLLPPATTVPVEVSVMPGVDALVPGTVAMHYRLDGGTYTDVSMTDNGGGDFTSTVPGANCSQLIEFYVTAEGEQAGVVSVHSAADPFTVPIGEIETILIDNMETDMGWSVSGDATAGMWDRGVPVNCSSRGAPGSDADGSGQCWLTGNNTGSGGDCNSDVDNGTTYLTSPIYDLPDGGRVTYKYWFADIASGGINGDEWGVDYSTNGGSTWTRLRTVTSVSPSWRSDTIYVGDEMPAGSNLRFRFSANDVGTQNVIEAGLDDLQISRQFCNDVSCPADINGDGILDLVDVQAFIAGFLGHDPVADLVAPFGVWDLADVQAFTSSFIAGCP
ncbi:MAG: S8 family serine peptidase [Phycisphaeraceae bacterium]|nr:MAG: S8 family serine peptidase [Phycisphaeraceae bacterium]